MGEEKEVIAHPTVISKRTEKMQVDSKAVYFSV